MLRFLRPVLLSFLLASSTLCSAQSGGPFLQPAERWCQIGDSITHNGTYHQWVSLFHLTRFPQVSFEAVNCGISGDTASRALRRFDWDIAPHKPTFASIMFGMNDVNRRLYDPAKEVTPAILQERREQLELYRKSLREIVTRLQQQGSRIVLITPSPYDQTSDVSTPKHTGVNEALADCTAFLQKLGEELKIPVVDFHTPLTQLTLRRQQDDPGFSLTRTDRVHPEVPAHFLMACLFLKAVNAPAEVSRISIDTRKGAAVDLAGGKLTELKTANGTLSFTWHADALPFPLYASVQPALAWFPFTHEFNRESLAVTGLPAGDYELRIDGVALGRYSAAALATGINLAENSASPQYQQALSVAKLWEKRTELIANDLRSLAFVEHRSFGSLSRPLKPEETRPLVEKELEARKKEGPSSYIRQQYDRYLERKAREAETLAEVARLTEEARRTAQPKPRTYTLAPVQ